MSNLRTQCRNVWRKESSGNTHCPVHDLRWETAGGSCYFDDTQDTPAAPDPVNPPHYRAHPSGIECIQVTRHFSFNLGNVIKYLWRAPLKGAQLEDLKKARWYLNDEIRALEKVETEIPK